MGPSPLKADCTSYLRSLGFPNAEGPCHDRINKNPYAFASTVVYEVVSGGDSFSVWTLESNTVCVYACRPEEDTRPHYRWL